jgi:intracellular sulfur oxidation DsrE/DsrF family protein
MSQAPLRLSILAVPALAALLCGADAAQGQRPGMQSSGPVINSGGPTFLVEGADFDVPPGHEFKAVWEIVERVEDTSQVHPEIVTIARFLNLHARHGVPTERIHAAAVVHGGGWVALLHDEAYGERFDGQANPTGAMIRELMANGVDIVLCGQTAGARGVDPSELLPGVQLGWSAMTALNVFQTQGYQLNPW